MAGERRAGEKVRADVRSGCRDAAAVEERVEPGQLCGGGPVDTWRRAERGPAGIRAVDPAPRSAACRARLGPAIGDHAGLDGMVRRTLVVRTRAMVQPWTRPVPSNRAGPASRPKARYGALDSGTSRGLADQGQTNRAFRKKASTGIRPAGGNCESLVARLTNRRGFHRCRGLIGGR